jgi:cobalamin synthase
MTKFVATAFRICGVILLVAGVLVAADGLLPMRSAGPNPSWFEFVFGAVICIAGWILRRVSFRKIGGV